MVKRLRELGVEIRSIEAAPWIEDVESRLGFHLPNSYRALVTCYAFPVLEFDAVELFGNQGNNSRYDITSAPFRDRIMSTWLSANRLLHIGHPYIGNYDPICLDLQSTAADPPIVRLDHEDILLERKKVRRSGVANNLIELLQTVQRA